MRMAIFVLWSCACSVEDSSATKGENTRAVWVQVCPYNDANQIAPNDGTGDVRGALQNCIDSTPSGGTVWITAGTYPVSGEVWVSGSKTLAGLGGPVRLMMLNHYARVVMPDVPNSVGWANVTEDWNNATGTFDPYWWFVPRAGYGSFQGLIGNGALPADWTPGWQTQVAQDNGNGTGQIYVVKTTDGNVFEYWKWDRSNIYYVNFDNSTNDRSGYGYYGAVIAPRNAAIGFWNQFNGTVRWWAPWTCNQTNYNQHFPTGLGLVWHGFYCLGGDVGCTDAIVLRHGNAGTEPFEDFYYSQGWGKVLWIDHNAAGAVTYKVYWNSKSATTVDANGWRYCCNF